jgi:hypothetical protein
MTNAGNHIQVRALGDLADALERGWMPSRGLRPIGRRLEQRVARWIILAIVASAVVLILVIWR